MQRMRLKIVVGDKSSMCLSEAVHCESGKVCYMVGYLGSEAHRGNDVRV